MKYIITFLLLTTFGFAFADSKTQYPAAPAVVAKEEPKEETWTTGPIVITNQDLRRHATILSSSNEQIESIPPLVFPEKTEEDLSYWEAWKQKQAAKKVKRKAFFKKLFGKTNSTK